MDTVVHYDRYQSKPGLPPFPTEMMMESGNGALNVTCRLFQEQVNTGLDDVFDFDGYAPRYVKSLDALEDSK
jgi:hypothetical protein